MVEIQPLLMLAGVIAWSAYFGLNGERGRMPWTLLIGGGLMCIRGAFTDWPDQLATYMSLGLICILLGVWAFRRDM